ncbi:hypothetical protein BJY04DRAFT_213774 [Aspergillus karnatakaensis]|uniref:uncharacterized protein n=1 Tax=Aspergillus karnatakaensis TaxID=1810916 RepID=UPI003CCDF920
MFETLQPTAYAVSFIFFTLASVTTVLRVYSRKCIIKSFGADDWWMVMVFWSKICNTAQQVHFCLFLSYGGGLHIEQVTDPNDIATLLKAVFRRVQLLFAEEILYIWMQFIIKQAFLIFYLRLASKTSFTYSVYATMVLNFLVTVAIWLLYCLQCRPLAAFWNAAAYPDATCLDTAVTYYVPVSLNITTDFIILLLPIRPLWSIQATLTRRLGVIAVVSVGGVAVIVSCLRIIVLHEFASNPDFTYILGKMVVISAVELNVAIMAANAPSLKAVWLKHVTGSLGSYLSSSVRLSSLAKNNSKGQRVAQEPVVIWQRVGVKGAKDRTLPDSSSMNNLVEPWESRDT